MIFLVGLGNPGETYQHTRHNVGFETLDVLKQNWTEHNHIQIPAFRLESKWKAEVAVAKGLVCVKPQTYMNLSGQAVRSVVQFYDKPLWQNRAQGLPTLWVCHDDLDIPLGSFKIQWGVGPKVHNGLSSLYQELGTELFWHVRIGIDDRAGDRSMPGAAYVLQKLPADEKQKLTQVQQLLSQRLLDAVKEKISL